MTIDTTDKQADLDQFDASYEQFVEVFKKIPGKALAYKPEGDDYALGGLIIHVIEQINYYSKVADFVISNQDGIHVSMTLSSTTKKLIEDGIKKEQVEGMLELLSSAHQRFYHKVSSLTDEQYQKKVGIYYEQAADAYPTAASDLLKWLYDHYLEHISQIKQLIVVFQKLDK